MICVLAENVTPFCSPGLLPEGVTVIYREHFLVEVGIEAGPFRAGVASGKNKRRSDGFSFYCKLKLKYLPLRQSYGL